MTNPSYKIDVNIDDEFDDLTVTGPPFVSGKNRRVPYRCKCGKEGSREIHSLLKKGQFKKSCGCNRVKIREQSATYTRDVFSRLAQQFYLGRLV